MTFKPLLLTALATLAFSAPSFADVSSADDVRITKITGSGSACQSDSRGRPTNWAYTISSDGKTFSADYSDFQMEKSDRKKTCTLTLILDVPAGKTNYTYSTQTRAEAEVKSGDKGRITTKIKLPGESRWKRTRTNISAGTDGDVTTRRASAKSKVSARCGGKTAKIKLEVTGQLNSRNSSFLEINSTDGRLSNVRTKSRDCE